MRAPLIHCLVLAGVLGGAFALRLSARPAPSAGPGLAREAARAPEAPSSGLVPHDPVVRRRLAEQLARLTPAPAPPDAEVTAWFSAHRDRYVEPERISFTQLFLDEKRRGPAALTSARAWLASLRQGRPPATGDPSIFPTHWDQKSEPEIAHLLGAAVAGQVITSPLDAWVGPLRSPFGLHLVRVTRRQPRHALVLSEIVEQVRADLLAARIAAADAERSPPPVTP
jgi:peptidyl-prolyl cis-trans isomerase C